MNPYIYVIIAAVLICTATIVIFYIREKNTYRKLNILLDKAIKDELDEKIFDETRLSALETKLANFLSASRLSARNISVEKDKIKTLIADISHQTKTPIANLLLYSELLSEQELPPEAKDYVNSLHSQTEKLKFLIDSLVKLSRLENGILVLNPEPTDIASMLKELYCEQLPKAKEKGLSLTVCHSDEPLKANIDIKWTEEAIGNLIDNAIKYTKDGGIEISYSFTDMFVRIDVKDTGIGIKEEEQAKIFGRFYRSQSVSKEAGVGIGLYLSREIISSEGGYMKVTSKEGEGSTFSVYLPIE